MLQYSPGLSAIQVADILRRSAREDLMTGFLAPTGSQIWGFGKADARTATGFYRLSIIKTLPRSAILRVLIDNNAVNVTEPWYDDYFLNGTTHSIAIMTAASAEPVRYQISNGNFTIHQSSIEVLEYSTQYYLDVRTSPFGESEQNSGWYDANSTIQLNYDPVISQPFGVKLIRIGWWASDLTMLSGSTIRLSHPLQVTGLYILTYPSEVVEVMLVISIAMLILMWFGKRSTSSSKEHQTL